MKLTPSAPLTASLASVRVTMVKALKIIKDLLAMTLFTSVTRMGDGGSSKNLFLVLKLREEEEWEKYVELKFEGLHLFMSQGVKMTFWLGYTLISFNEDGSITLFKDDSPWDAVANGGQCWWINFSPFLVFSKQAVGTIYLYAQTRRFKVTARADSEPTVTELDEDWVTPVEQASDDVKKESTWDEVKGQ